MTNEEKDELTALKARVAELERAAKPPEPFKPADYVPFDPTARMSMPISTIREMASAVPDDVCASLARDNRGPTGPKSILPQSDVGTGRRAPVNTSGFVDSAPIRPPPGIRYVDAQLDHQDQVDLAERLARQEAIRRARLGRRG